ncbi:MAG: class I SAM-dependent methyltransferase [Candidatus Vogelbacteria bacterium]|nr:class I SAM-dependent methyltransferase [Candidatus Vogelbacteria bacterium]
MDSKIIEAYNKFGDRYDEQTALFWEQFPKTFIESFRAGLNTGKDILNIGSGPGRDSLILKMAGFNVTCLDASESMVEATTTKGFNSVQADLMELPFGNSSFDGAWAYTSLLHLPKSKIVHALQEIKRILKPSGILALGMIEGDEEKYVEDKFVIEPRLFSYYSKSDLESLLEESGFQIYHFEQFTPKRFTYLNFIVSNA